MRSLLSLCITCIASTAAADINSTSITPVDEDWTTMPLSNAALNGTLIAETVTINGGDPGVLRMKNGKIKFQETTGNGSHNNETVDLISFRGDLVDMGIPGERGSLNTDDGAFSVDFDGTYQDPVVFLQVRTYNGSDTVMANVTAVDANGFDARLQESKKFNGRHATETIDWVVIEAGDWHLTDGRTVRVGTIDIPSSDNDGFRSAALGAPFVGAAQVVTRLQSMPDSDFGATRTLRHDAGGITTSVETRYMYDREDNDFRVPGCTIGYVAIADASGTLAGRHRSGVEDWTSLGMSAAEQGGVVFGQVLTNSVDDAMVTRLSDNNTITIQEPTTTSDGGVVTPRVINAIALADNLHTLGLQAETGSITMADGTRTVAFHHAYDNPVVFVEVASDVGFQTVSANALSVGADSLTIALTEHSSYDGSHATETVHWAVVEAGNHLLNDGRRLIVGTVDAAAGEEVQVDLIGQFAGANQAVADRQGLPDERFAGVWLRKGYNGDGISSINLRTMGEDDRAGHSTGAAGTIGYMVIGAPRTCGNGSIDAGEECDHAGLPSATCASDCTLPASDFDGDDNPDMVITAVTGETQVCLGDGCGGFTCADLPGVSGAGLQLGAAVGDMDEDGDVDILTIQINSAVQLCRNAGDGTFDDCEILSGAGSNNPSDGYSIEVADMNGDGRNDFVTSGLLLGYDGVSFSKVCLNQGGGEFRCDEMDGGHSMDVAIGDLNGDGLKDFVLARNEYTPKDPADGGLHGRNRVCLADGAGDWDCSNISNNDDASEGVAVGDLDGDGDLDAVFANVDNDTELCLNDGSGSFTCSYIDTGAAGRDVAIADLEGDGDMDMVFANLEERNETCVNAGDGTFSCWPQSGDTYSTREVALRDVNGDGLMDAVFVTELDDEPNQVCLGDSFEGGNGTFFFFGQCQTLYSGTMSMDVAITGGDASAVCE